MTKQSFEYAFFTGWYSESFASSKEFCPTKEEHIALFMKETNNMSSCSDVFREPTVNDVYSAYVKDNPEKERHEIIEEWEDEAVSCWVIDWTDLEGDNNNEL